MKNGFCPGIQLRVKIQQENANIARAKTYSEAHQKFGNPGKKIFKTATK
jgi:hypothetical protein